MKVFTSITGDKEDLIEDQNTKGADFIAFTNQESETWETRPPCNLFKNRRYNAKPPKLLSHLYVDTDTSLWIDGNVRLKIPMSDLVNVWFDEDTDIALTKHPSKRDPYQEVDILKRLDWVDKDEANEFKRFLYNIGTLKGKRMGECNIILRRHNEKVKRFNNEWFSHLIRFIHRDQPSFNALLRLYRDLNFKFIEPNIRNHPAFDYLEHKDKNRKE